MIYCDLIEAALSEAARKAFFMLPPGYEFQGRTARESFLRGRASEKATDVLAVLDARGLVITDAERQRILGCGDLETLSLWLRRAVTAGSTDAVFEGTLPAH